MNRKFDKQITLAATALAATLLFGVVSPAQADWRLFLDIEFLDVVIDDHGFTGVANSITMPIRHPGNRPPGTAPIYNASSNYSSFHEELNGYGEWAYYPGFDSDVWFPYVDPDWRPYVHGHWINTTHGMTWVAYEPWGWIPHHYGRWVYFEEDGWGWIPGYEYGPAWVTWSVVDGHVGWAPLPPAGFRYFHRSDYSYAGDNWRYGYNHWTDYHPSGIAFSHWVFVPNRYFYDTSIFPHMLPRSHCSGFFHSRRVLPIGPIINLVWVTNIVHRPIYITHVTTVIHEFDGRTISHPRPIGQNVKIKKGRELARNTGHISTRGDRSVTRRSASHFRTDGTKQRGGYITDRNASSESRKLIGSKKTGRADAYRNNRSKETTPRYAPAPKSRDSQVVKQSDRSKEQNSRYTPTKNRSSGSATRRSERPTEKKKISESRDRSGENARSGENKTRSSTEEKKKEGSSRKKSKRR